MARYGCREAAENEGEKCRMSGRKVSGHMTVLIITQSGTMSHTININM